ncbi:hypothetical protein DGWBC_0987 [Dehalogenimonas sp. WBC-2]|nr:hypothetical protein DGWBC_0987 [Dehalogenimonas sp. WBC-2]
MKIAEETDAKSIIIYMETPREVAQNRLTKRIAERESYSDANWEVYQMLEGKYEPIKSSHLTVKSHMDISPVIDRIVSEVNRLK